MATNSSSLSLSDKIAFYKKEIRNIADTSFNKIKIQYILQVIFITERNIVARRRAHLVAERVGVELRQ